MAKPKVVTLYTPDETQALRDQLIETSVVPVVAKAFSAYPALQTCILMVGQFWCDEAYDAVHYLLLYSTSKNPDLGPWEAETTRILQAIGRGKMDDEEYEFLQAAYSSFVEGPAALQQLGGNWDPDRLNQFNHDNWCEGWDSNYQAIPLFAAFCPEGASPDSSLGEAHGPCCLFQRNPANSSGLEIRMVKEMARPWLEGVKPEGEE
jgi:hypothetical protein